MVQLVPGKERKMKIVWTHVSGHGLSMFLLSLGDLLIEESLVRTGRLGGCCRSRSRSSSSDG